MPSLKSVLKEVKKELEEKEKIREDAHNSMRKATSLSKRAILFIHQKKTEETKKSIEQARQIISELSKAAETNPEIIHGGLFNAALQEYSEANILLGLTEKSKFVTPQKIRVPSVDYVLGLADVIGECRRLALDALREGNLEKSEEWLKTMDEIYIELMALDEAYMLVPGLRRKCDVARKVIEATRGDITQEVRRDVLEKSLKRFESLMRKRKT
jgi:translin